MTGITPGPGTTIVYDEAFSGPTNATGVGAWEDWNLSAIVPLGARFAVVMCVVANGRSHGVRTDGSVVERRLATTGVTTWLVKVSSSRIVERYTAGLVADVAYYVVGWI